jgi:hypothetical protein
MEEVKYSFYTNKSNMGRQIWGFLKNIGMK